LGHGCIQHRRERRVERNGPSTRYQKNTGARRGNIGRRSSQGNGGRGSEVRRLKHHGRKPAGKPTGHPGSTWKKNKKKKKRRGVERAKGPKKDSIPT